MANTFTQIHIQLIFATKFRQALISEKWENRLYEYITGIIQNHKHKVLAINGMPDHIHILIGFRSNQALSDLVREIKKSSTHWINEVGLTQFKFAWQEGYGAFSYSKSHVSQVINYIHHQKTHHEKIRFIDEYVKILETLEIEFDSTYIFSDPK